MRDAAGTTEGSRAKHRNEVKPKAARPKHGPMIWRGARPKIRTNSFSIFQLIDVNSYFIIIYKTVTKALEIIIVTSL